MNSINKKTIDVIKKVKDWCGKQENKKYLNAAALFFAAFLWVYILTGSPIVSLVFAAVGFSVSITKEALKSKKRFLYLLTFWGISILAFALTYACFTPTRAWFSIGIWLIVYCAFSRATKLTEWITGSIIPMLVVLISEAMQNNVKAYLHYIFAAEDVTRFGFVISIMLVAVVFSFLIHLFNGKRIGYYVGVGIFGVLCYVNYFVYTITEQPFTLSDLNIAITAAGVLNTQKLYFKDWLGAILSLLMWAALILIITVVYKKDSGKKKLSARVVPVGVLLGVLLIAYSASGWLTSTLLMFNGHLKYGFIGNFYITMDSSLRIPEDAKNYVIEDKNDDEDYTPNVIIIMNEAFTDLGTTFDIELTEDPLPYFHSLQEKYPSGVTYSSVKGNNTCSSEWELLSGTPTALTAKGAVVYQYNTKPMRSLVSLFESRGYTTVGLHPYFARGYNRETFYNSLGFDKTVFIEDMPDNLSKIREYVTDEADYMQLIKLYEENEDAGDKPFFCFNITMQNHGGYVVNQMDDIRVDGEKTYADVNTYLSVLKYSDEALKTLISYFESVEEDTVILFFGDHQPMIDNGFYEDIYGKSYDTLSVEERKEVYAVPYLIWANYDLNKEAAPAETSNCYLSSILFDVGNIPKSTWINMIGEYREKYPVISSVFIKENDGDIKTTDSVLKSGTIEENDPLLIYQKYSYGVLYGLE